MTRFTLALAGAGLSALMALTFAPARAADLGTPEGSYKDDPFPVVYNSPWYFALRGGATFPQDTQFDVFGLGVSSSYDDVGYFLSGAVGYDMSALAGVSGFRGELELGYLSNAINAHTIDTLGTSTGGAASGDTSMLLGFANLYYDFETGSGFKPFVGGGLGFANVDFSRHGTTATGTVLDDSSTAFAWNLTAGATLAVAANTDLELGYKFIEAVGVDVNSIDGTRNSIDVDNHVIYAGIKFRM